MQSINPYDLGRTTNSLRAVKLNDLIRTAHDKFKLEFVKSTLDINGFSVQLTTSKTRFNGNRYWFVCPICQTKRGVIYLDKTLGCRTCLNLKYRKQRYKGMVELFIPTS